MERTPGLLLQSAEGETTEQLGIRPDFEGLYFPIYIMKAIQYTSSKKYRENVGTSLLLVTNPAAVAAIDLIDPP